MQHILVYTDSSSWGIIPICTSFLISYQNHYDYIYRLVGISLRDRPDQKKRIYSARRPQSLNGDIPASATKVDILAAFSRCASFLS